MRNLILLAVIFLSSTAQASTIFPPADCRNNEMRVLGWQQDAETTYCLGGDDILTKLSYNTCNEGEILVYRDARPGFECVKIHPVRFGQRRLDASDDSSARIEYEEIVKVTVPSVLLVTASAQAVLEEGQGNGRGTLNSFIAVDGTGFCRSNDNNIQAGVSVATMRTSTACQTLVLPGKVIVKAGATRDQHLIVGRFTVTDNDMSWTLIPLRSVGAEHGEAQ